MHMNTVQSKDRQTSREQRNMIGCSEDLVQSRHGLGVPQEKGQNQDTPDFTCTPYLISCFWF